MSEIAILPFLSITMIWNLFVESVVRPKYGQPINKNGGMKKNVVTSFLLQFFVKNAEEVRNLKRKRHLKKPKIKMTSNKANHNNSLRSSGRGKPRPCLRRYTYET